MTQIPTGASKEALLCIGSNCGDRTVNVESALEWLVGIMSDFRHSSIYATPDCHGGKREYLNAVCLGKTFLNATELDKLCKEFELSLGRNYAARKAGDVPVDVDIVVFDEDILRERDYASEFFRIGYKELYQDTLLDDTP